MSAVTIRNLDPTVHQALKQRALAHGRSTEAEIRFILEAAVQPRPASWVDELQALGREAGITTEFDHLRDPTPARILTFE